MLDAINLHRRYRHQHTIVVAWVAQKKRILAPSNMQIDNLIYGD
jgi:hypothetical protein